MRSFVQFIQILIATLLLLIAGAASSQSLSLVCDNYPPYQIVRNGSVDGYSTRLVRVILKEMGVGITSLDVLPWKRAMGHLENNMADALFSANFTKERAAFAHYPSESLVQSPWVVWVREDTALQYNSFEDLNGGIIGVVRGYAYTPEFWQYLNRQQNFEEETDDDTNFRKLSAGRLQFVIAELGNGYQIIHDLQLQGIVPLTDRPIKTDGLFIIFNKKTVSKEFVDEFSQKLRSFRSTEAYRSIHDSYFGH